MAAGRHAKALLVVQEGTLALFRPEDLVGGGIVDHAGHQLPLPLQGNGDAVMRNGVQEVGRAVEGIDDPAVGLVGPLHRTPLLGQEAIARTQAAELLHQHLLGLGVGGGDEVGGPLLGHLQFRHLAEVAGELAPGLAGGVDHHLDEIGGSGHGAVSPAREKRKRRNLVPSGQKAKREIRGPGSPRRHGRPRSAHRSAVAPLRGPRPDRASRDHRPAGPPRASAAAA